jgi:hypothetical protein
MDRPQPIFVGYRVKRITRASRDLRDRATHYGRLIKEVASVSDCLAAPPADWQSRGGFNPAGCYNTPEAAEASMAPGEDSLFARYAYEIFPVKFDGEHASPIDLEAFFDAPPSSFPAGHPPNEYRLIGYDLVNAEPATPAQEGVAPTMARFDCSPLSCNDMAAECRGNRYCLLDSWEEVAPAAARFLAEHAEPGPYHVFAVYRRDVK